MRDTIVVKLRKHKKRKIMTRGSTFILKATIVLMGLVILGLCTLALPQAIAVELTSDFDYLPILIGLYIPAIPFFIALYQALRILSFIDANTAFSLESVRALKHIKLSAYVISALFTTGMPYIFYIAELDDAPGLAALGFIIVGASFIIGTAAAVFQKLLQHAVTIKSENDFTV